MVGKESLHEIKCRWTIDDLMDAHEALDIQAEMEHHLMEQHRAGRGAQ